MNYLFTIRDEVTETIGQPFVAHTTKQAVRIFKQAMKNPKINAKDFSLLFLAEINTDNGVITNCNPTVIDVDDEQFENISAVDTELTENVTE